MNVHKPHQRSWQGAYQSDSDSDYLFIFLPGLHWNREDHKEYNILSQSVICITFQAVFSEGM